MAITFGASLGTPGTDTENQATTITLTTNVTVPSGGTLFVGVSWYNAGVTASMSGGSLTWSQVKQQNGASDTSRHLALFKAVAPSGLASSTTLTATFSGNSFGRAIFGCYFTGADSGGAADGTAVGTSSTGSGGGTQPYTAGNVTLTNTDSLLVQVAWFDGENSQSSTPNVGTEALDFTNSGVNNACWTFYYRLPGASGAQQISATWALPGSFSPEWLVIAGGFAAASGGGATVTAVVADATGSAPAAAVSSGVTVGAVPASAAGSAPVASVSGGGSVTVTAVPATAAGTAPVAAISAGTTVTAVPAAATGSAPPANSLISVVVNAPAVVATGTAPAASVTAGGDRTVAAVPAAAAGSAPAAGVSGDVTVAAVVADATGSAPAASTSQGVTVSAVPAAAVGRAPVPAVTPSPAGNQLVSVAATFAEDSV